MKTKLFAIIVIALLLTAGAVSISTAQTVSFRFASIGDGQADSGRFASTVNQIATHDPDFILFNGDLENDGFTTGGTNPMVNALREAGLFDNTFLVRGNHDNHVSGSATLWENYFDSNTQTRPAGVENYTPLSATTERLTYSFDYGNSIFIGLDTPGDIGTTSTAARTFLDNRLTYAEQAGLTHAFVFFHSGEYCISSVHCSCTGKADGSCTPSWWVTIANKHPIISATFHGHEHILGWVQMDSARVADLDGSYQEFFTSPAGGWTYNSYMYPLRVNYFYPTMGNSTGFAMIDVNGADFTVSFYKVGTGSAVWSKTFSKSGTTPQPTLTASATLPAVTRTATQPAGPTRTPTLTRTPAAPTVTRTPGTPGTGRPLKYYGVDRVLAAADFSWLSARHVNTVVKLFDVNGSATVWRSAFTSAQAAGMDIVIWLYDGTHPRANCGWESPFPVTLDGNIDRVKALMDVASEYSNWIGIVSSHEPAWTSCPSTIREMTGLKTKLKDYAASKGRPDVKVWNYIDNITDIPNISDYSGPADYDRIMDVAVIWQHCAGGAESACTSGSNSTLSKINKDRQLLDSAGSQVELVFLMQTFTSGSKYATKFTLAQLQDYSCQFLATNVLDGFAFYTWDAGWWSDLHSWTAQRPAIAYVYENCVGNVATATSVVSATPIPGATATVTRTPVPVLTRTSTLTRTPVPVVSVTLTASAVPTVTGTLETPAATRTATPLPVTTPAITPTPQETPPTWCAWKKLLQLVGVSIWACYK